MNHKASQASAPPLALIEAANALRAQDVRRAEALIRTHLATDPENVEALRLLAGVAAATGYCVDAEQLLRRAIAHLPTFISAYIDLSSLLCRLNRAGEAISLLDDVIGRQPSAHWALSLKASILTDERRVREALVVHEDLLALAPEAAIPLMNYGYALKTVGRFKEAVVAYRKSLDIDPANGFSWCGLANLRTVVFDEGDVYLLERALRNASDNAHLTQLHFALGKALGDLGRFEGSFRHYQQANDIRRKLVPYDPATVGTLVNETEAVFTPEFIKRNTPGGVGGAEVIFIVGMPRSGSTLIEQILASHPMVEGLGELFELQNIATRLIGTDPIRAAWPQAVANLSAAELRSLGENYLESARRFKKTDRPFFTDKMPSNWQHIGLIQLMLPEAKIVDARRHPLACCFSNFTTYFNLQTSVPNSLEELAQHYGHYVRMMAHFDAVAPSRIQRVHLERVIADFENEVRRLLAYLNVPFDQGCLRFNENSRAIHTPSAAQVRQPINTEGLGRWRNYEKWLSPLYATLESSSGEYRDTPLR